MSNPVNFNKNPSVYNKTKINMSPTLNENSDTVENTTIVDSTTTSSTVGTSTDSSNVLHNTGNVNNHTRLILIALFILFLIVVAYLLFNNSSNPSFAPFQKISPDYHIKTAFGIVK